MLERVFKQTGLMDEALYRKASSEVRKDRRVAVTSCNMTNLKQLELSSPLSPKRLNMNNSRGYLKTVLEQTLSQKSNKNDLTPNGDAMHTIKPSHFNAN